MAAVSWVAVVAIVVLAGLFLLKKYLSGGVCRSKARLDGKTVIITRANTGIGKETALDLAKRGARVILACRDLDKANTAANEIREASGNSGILVKNWTWHPKIPFASLQTALLRAKRSWTFL